MNLQHLRDEVPLTELDYAAVRARVRSEIERRQHRRAWVFRFASAFAAAALAVLALIPIDPAVAPATHRGAAGFSPPKIVAERSGGLKPAAPQVIASKHHHRRRSRRITNDAQVAVSRIEIHTADPDVRIIWIVPKENS